MCWQWNSRFTHSISFLVDPLFFLFFLHSSFSKSTRPKSNPNSSFSSFILHSLDQPDPNQTPRTNPHGKRRRRWGRKERRIRTRNKRKAETYLHQEEWPPSQSREPSPICRWDDNSWVGLVLPWVDLVFASDLFFFFLLFLLLLLLLFSFSFFLFPRFFSGFVSRLLISFNELGLVFGCAFFFFFFFYFFLFFFFFFFFSFFFFSVFSLGLFPFFSIFSWFH